MTRLRYKRFAEWKKKDHLDNHKYMTTPNPSSLQGADPQDEIKALKEALAEKSEEIKRLQKRLMDADLLLSITHDKLKPLLVIVAGMGRYLESSAPETK